MTAKDMISISVNNLFQRKLRASLTILGVAIAIAAFIAMLSFGVGMQQTISNQFAALGLFTTMQVYPGEESSATDTTQSEQRKLNQAALEKISNLPGVQLAYPMESFQVTVSSADTGVEVKAQALPTAALKTKLYSAFEAGDVFSSDSAREVILMPELVEKLGYQLADSLIGKKVVISIGVASIDSAIVNVLVNLGNPVHQIQQVFEAFQMSPDSVRARLSNLLGQAATNFLSGYFEKKKIISDTLLVRGVLDVERHRRLKPAPVILPPRTAARLNVGGPADDPVSLVTSIKDGSLFYPKPSSTADEYSKVTLDLNPHVPYQEIQDKVDAMGFKTFCFATQYKAVQQFFLLFDIGMGGIGAIALLIASMGIVNTMVMSVVERRREIGVLKSLGAHEGDIRWLFLAESALIGVVGSLAGIVIGWVVTLIATLVGKIILANMGEISMQELDRLSLFALPLWLIGAAVLFGVAVSLAAGLYPSARAAGVDPVQALRDE
ncbi:hypothetical protein AMJ86_04450 [bacterium SM23_57]|nr:MAG: hypothetical protein AMJ86_04450 [bacterium SM23_57]